MRKGAQELKDLDVDRVDGVDKPATGRNFLLFKAEDGDAIMKGYGMLATVAHEVLSKMRTDKNAVVSRKSAVALNGLAQVLGEDAVFVGKAVPTQPYQFTEPDGNKRGPADENLGENFTPRSMPGSMVGSVQFRMKDEAEDEEEGKDKAKGARMYDEEDAKGKGKSTAKAHKDEAYDEEEEDAKRKAAAAKAKAAAKDEEMDDEMDASERANRGVARSIQSMAKAIESQTAAINKIIGLAKIAKGEEETEQAEPVKPRSRQVEDEPRRVRKSGYEPRFGVSFTDVAFGQK